MDDIKSASPDGDNLTSSLGSSLPPRYQVKEIIGRGGMGVVFRAHDLGLSRDVAIKILLFQGAQTEGRQERFLREARALASLDHPNIVKFFTAGATDRQDPFYVMEFLEGTTLARELLESGRLAPSRFFEICKQVLDGLSCAHEHNMVHRDLKPGNIMLCTDDDAHTIVKIIDFGIARELTPEALTPALTATSVVLGSPAYVSPEQCRREPADKRSDIYSMGCIMYECLSGVPPFQGETALEVMYKHMSQPVPGLAALAKTEGGKRLAALVEQCLDKDPSRRPENADEIKTRLSEIFEKGAKEIVLEGNGRKQSRPPGALIVGGTLASLAAIIFALAQQHHLSGIQKEVDSVIKEQVEALRLKRSAEIVRLKEEVARKEHHFYEMTPVQRSESEETLTLLKLMQYLARAQLQSELHQDLVDSKDTCTDQLSIAESAGIKERIAAGYILRGQAKILLGEYAKAEQDYDACKDIILQLSGKHSNRWVDFEIYRAMLNMRRGRFKEAETDLRFAFEFWLDNDDFNPKKAINVQQELDREGPDRKSMVYECLKTLQKVNLGKPDDVATAVAITNMLSMQLLDFKMGIPGRESITFSLKLLPRVPAGNDSIKAQTIELAKKYLH
jgi:serine/threonine protein kinase